MQTSSQFRQQHKIYLSCPISYRKSEVDRNSGGYPVRTPETDYLDINNNGQLDIGVRGGYHAALRDQLLVTQEPCLRQTFSQLEDLANSMDVSVLTQDDVRGVEYGYPVRRYIRMSQPQTTFSSLDNIEIGGAIPRNAKWAIDVDNREFFLYRG